MKSIDLYNEAPKITEVSNFQRGLFDETLHTCTKKQRDRVFGMVAFDTETTGLTFGAPSYLHLDNMDVLVHDIKVFGISLAIPTKDGLALIWGRYGTPLFEACCKFLEHDFPKVGHNVRYDYRVMRRNGFKVGGELNCTLTMARVFWNRRKRVALDKLVGFVFPEMDGYESELKAVLRNLRSSHTRAGYPKDYVNYSFIPDDIISKYAMLDVFVTWLLNLYFMPHMLDEYKELYDRERRVIPVIADIEDRGVPFNRRRASKESKRLLKRVPTIERKLFKEAGCVFNPNSPKQLLGVLLSNLKIPKSYLTEKGKLTTKKEVLEKAVEKLDKRKNLKVFVQQLLDLRSINKIVGTYLNPLYMRANDNAGIVYCNINPADSRTGRMTSTNPNLQNVPRPVSIEQKHNPVRKCFTCRPGFCNLFFDYKQMEMWLTAITTGETRMLEFLQSGQDIHTATAILVLGEEEALDKNGIIYPHHRQLYKHANFAIIYGMGTPGFAEWMRITKMYAHEVRTAYFEAYPEILAFVDECKHELQTKGYVEDLFGKRYSLNPRDAYKAINALVQGGCAQIFKTGLLKIDRYISKHTGVFRYRKPGMLLPIHDEMWMQYPLDRMEYLSVFVNKIKDCMEQIPQLEAIGIPRLPVDVKISYTDWESKEKYDG